jgi:hypothetical protein
MPIPVSLMVRAAHLDLPGCGWPALHPDRDIPVGQHFKTHAIEGIRSVRNQLAQKDLSFGIKGVHQDVQKLADLCSKGHGCRF